MVRIENCYIETRNGEKIFSCHDDCADINLDRYLIIPIERAEEKFGVVFNDPSQ